MKDKVMNRPRIKIRPHEEYNVTQSTIGNRLTTSHRPSKAIHTRLPALEGRARRFDVKKQEVLSLMRQSREPAGRMSRVSPTLSIVLNMRRCLQVF